jgi:hypothetical protein
LRYRHRQLQQLLLWEVVRGSRSVRHLLWHDRKQLLECPWVLLL